MDVISEAVTAIRAGSASSRRVKERGSWGLRYPAFAGSGFHIVLSGCGWLVTASGPPRALRPGDVVLVPAGAEHGLSRTPRVLDALPAADMSGTPPTDGPADFEFLCGAYRLGRGPVHPYTARPLPRRPGPRPTRPVARAAGQRRHAPSPFFGRRTAHTAGAATSA